MGRQIIPLKLANFDVSSLHNYVYKEKDGTRFIHYDYETRMLELTIRPSGNMAPKKPHLPMPESKLVAESFDKLARAIVACIDYEDSEEYKLDIKAAKSGKGGKDKKLVEAELGDVVQEKRGKVFTLEALFNLELKGLNYTLVEQILAALVYFSKRQIRGLALTDFGSLRHPPTLQMYSKLSTLPISTCGRLVYTFSNYKVLSNDLFSFLDLMIISLPISTDTYYHTVTVDAVVDRENPSCFIYPESGLGEKTIDILNISESCKTITSNAVPKLFATNSLKVKPYGKVAEFSRGGTNDVFVCNAHYDGLFEETPPAVNITKLPPAKKVAGPISLSATNIPVLPEGVKVKTEIEGVEDDMEDEQDHVIIFSENFGKVVVFGDHIPRGMQCANCACIFVGLRFFCSCMSDVFCSPICMYPHTTRHNHVKHCKKKKLNPKSVLINVQYSKTANPTVEILESIKELLVHRDLDPKLVIGEKLVRRKLDGSVTSSELLFDTESRDGGEFIKKNTPAKTTVELFMEEVSKEYRNTKGQRKEQRKKESLCQK